MPDFKLLDLPANELKRLLATSTNLGEVVHFFFDHFAENRGFLEASHPVEVPPALKDGLGPLVAKLWPKQNILTEWAVGEVALLGIVHGSVFLGSTSAIVLWVPGLQLGIIAIPNGKRGDILYARISILPNSKATRQ
jgi:hypothetical protein